MVRFRFGRSAVVGTAVAAVLAAAPVVTMEPARAEVTAPASTVDSSGQGLPALPGDDPFYTSPGSLADVPPGTVLRSRPVVVRGLGLPMPVAAWQVLYRSTDAQGRPNAVSGTVGYALDGRPAAGRPLVAYNVGSHGLAAKCAPSYHLRLGVEQEEPLMAGLVARGWAVMVTDYEGLGTPGPHTYASGLATGRAVLDGIRAAQSLQDAALGKDGPVGIWGYSEGGLASTWATELASDYAPELNLVGTAAGGVPVDLGNVAKRIDGTYLSGFLLAAAVGLDRAYPSMRLEELLNADGRDAARKIAGMCAVEWAAAYGNLSLAELSTVPDPLAVPRVKKIIDENRLGTRTPEVPMYIYESVNDQFMPIEDVRGLVENYCGKGVPVQYHEDRYSEHLFLAGSGAYAAMDWLAGRFAGAPAPSTC